MALQTGPQRPEQRRLHATQPSEFPVELGLASATHWRAAFSSASVLGFVSPVIFFLGEGN